MPPDRADRAVADLESFLAERGEPLLRTAVLLAGSKEAGEDLLQAALERLLKHWRTIEGNQRGTSPSGPSSSRPSTRSASAGLRSPSASVRSQQRLRAGTPKA